MSSATGPELSWALTFGDVQMNPMQLEAQKNKMMKSAISMRLSITLIITGIDIQFLHCYLLYITPEQCKIIMNL